MKKLFLLLLIFIGATASIPALRARVVPHVAPLWATVAEALEPVVGTMLNPVYRWSAVSEAERIARELRQHEAGGHPLPAPTELTAYLKEQTYTGRGGLDPWGMPYALIVTQDSILIGSLGPDGAHGTDDDVRRGVARR